VSHYKPYPDYKDSGVEWLGKVPEHWAVCKLSFRYSIELGKMLDEKKLTKTSLVPYLRNQDVQWGLINTDELPEMDIHPGELDRYSVRNGDLLVCEGGDVGRAAIWRGEGLTLGYQKALHRLRHRCVDTDTAEFFYFSLLTAKQRGVFEESDSKATIAHLPAEKFRQYRFAFPPRLEQLNIAVYLDRETTRIDALVEKKTRFIELLREKRQALITHAVTKGLDPNVKMKDSGVEWLGDVPEHWDVVQLRHKAKLASGHTPSRSHPEYWIDCDTPWFTLADVWQVRSGESKFVYDTSEKVSQLGLANSSARLLPAGSVFLSRTASVGFSGIMGVDMATSQDFAVWTCGNSLKNEFLYYVLRGMRGEFDRLMMGSTHKTIYMPDIEALRVARPPLDEQKSIVEFLSSQFQALSKIIDKSELSLSLLKERRSALITAAVTGQIDLREAS